MERSCDHSIEVEFSLKYIRIKYCTTRKDKCGPADLFRLELMHKKSNLVVASYEYFSELKDAASNPCSSFVHKKFVHNIFQCPMHHMGINRGLFDDNKDHFFNEKFLNINE